MTEITNENIKNHLAQCDYLITTSKSEKVIVDAKETKKVILDFQLRQNAERN